MMTTELKVVYVNMVYNTREEVLYAYQKIEDDMVWFDAVWWRRLNVRLEMMWVKQ